MPFEWDLSNLIEIKSNEKKLDNAFYIRKLDRWGNLIKILYSTICGKSNTIINGNIVGDNTPVVIYDGLKYLLECENKYNDIIGSGIFEDFSSKYWMKSFYNKQRDENNINPNDYTNVKKYVYILSFYDGIDTCPHMLSENPIDLNDDKLNSDEFKKFKQEVKDAGGKLIVSQYLIHYQTDKNIDSTKYRLCYMMNSDNLVATRLIRAVDDYEFKNNGEYQYEMSGPIQPDILYEEGLMNA